MRAVRVGVESERGGGGRGNEEGLVVCGGRGGFRLGDDERHWVSRGWVSMGNLAFVLTCG